MNRSPSVPRRGWLLLALVPLALPGSPAAVRAADPPARPNVVLILADDLGPRDLGCTGSTFHKTPHLDRMAKDGLLFTNSYAACPVCSPTRASLLTGRYPQRFGLTDWLPGRPDRPDQRLKRPALRQELPLEEVTLAEALRAAGYATGHIGKWHLGGPGFGPREQGFDVNVAGDHTGTARSYFAPFRNAQGVMPGLEDAPAGEYLTDRLAAEAEKFIDAHKDRPFFLYLPHYAPHTPLKAKAETVARYPGKPAHGRQGHPVYAAMVESLDDAVGRVLARLDALKLTNTIVLFTSDNGGLATLEGMPFAPTFNGPLREGKGYLYEGGVRAPLLVRWPGHVKPGATTDAVVSSIDLLPTLLAACGVKAPDGCRPDGVSLVPAFTGEALPDRALFWHYPHYANQGSRPGGAVRHGDFKLIEHYEDGRRELFDVRRDPSESRNLAADRPDLVRDLAGRLGAWRQEVGAREPTPNPDYVPNPQALDGSITLHARTARVHGAQLRYEPLPHKDTLGFWTRADDWAEFDFTAARPGRYAVEVVQGCGAGSGGAEVVLAVGGQSLTFTVKDTGGFQNFEPRAAGELALDRPGRHTLTVKARTKPGVAVMDLRRITLRPAG